MISEHYITIIIQFNLYTERHVRIQSLLIFFKDSRIRIQCLLHLIITIFIQFTEVPVIFDFLTLIENS